MTAHHRIVASSLTGSAESDWYGKQGLSDGSFTEAQFFGPQGMAFDQQNSCCIADTENHALRRINLKLQVVETIATGEQSHNIHPHGGLVWKPL